jgi:hypothetical protein
LLAATGEGPKEQIPSTDCSTNRENELTLHVMPAKAGIQKPSKPGFPHARE